MSLLKNKMASFFKRTRSEGDKETADRVISPDDLACKERVKAALEEMLVLMRDERWRHEKTVGTDVVKSLQTSSYGTIFKYEGKMEASASALFDKLHHNYEPTNWNPTLSHVKRLRQIDENTDAQYTVAQEYAAGLISKRDYVYLRTWQKRGNTIVLGLTSSSELLSFPLQDGLIRGEQGPSGYILTPCGEGNAHCQVQWICNTRLGGWLPEILIDKAFPKALLEIMNALRNLEGIKKTES